jgi:deoxyribose-phosphate aldolase
MELFSKYHYPFSVLGLNEKVNAFKEDAVNNYKVENLRKIFGLIDLTSLNSTDSISRIKGMCQKVNTFKDFYPDFPSVAAICVYPNFVRTVKETLNDKNVSIACVAAGFPSSQTFLKIKLEESKMAVEQGADEVDIVISLGEFLNGNYQLIFDEIASIKEAIGKAHLKVILETGALSDPLRIWEASLISMHAGADFIKTSTGKMQPAATPESVVVMTEAIKAFKKETGKKTGLKPAGGIATGSDAAIYYTIVEKTLGNEWLNPGLFRIGASSLANNLISESIEISTGEKKQIGYF